MADRLENEREVFELYVLSEGIAVQKTLTRNASGHYLFADIRAMWLGWAARAAAGVDAKDGGQHGKS